MATGETAMMIEQAFNLVISDTKSAPTKKWRYYTSTQVDTCANKHLVKICKFGTTAALQYVIFTKEDDGRETSQLLPIGTNAFEARAILGKVIVVPACKGHGEPTNVRKESKKKAA